LTGKNHPCLVTLIDLCVFVSTGVSQSADSTTESLASVKVVGNFRTLQINTTVGSWGIELISTNPYSIKVIGKIRHPFILYIFYICLRYLFTKYLTYIFILGVFTVHLLLYYFIVFILGILRNLWQNNFLRD